MGVCEGLETVWQWPVNVRPHKHRQIHLFVICCAEMLCLAVSIWNTVSSQENCLSCTFCRLSQTQRWLNVWLKEVAECCVSGKNIHHVSDSNVEHLSLLHSLSGFLKPLILKQLFFSDCRRDILTSRGGHTFLQLLGEKPWWSENSLN